MEVHGNKYDYSLVQYVNSTTKVKIICMEHGIFEQNYVKHCKLSRGCWDCGKKSRAEKNRRATEEYVEIASQKHNNFYSYDKTIYTRSIEKLIITCPLHGDFLQQAQSHLQGVGCNKCVRLRIAEQARKGKDAILKRFRETHGNFYEYELTDEIKTRDLISIECPVHGKFLQLVLVHYRSGCPKCGDERTGEYQRNKPKELDRICSNLRRRIKKFMQKRGYTKKEKICDVLGCTWDQFKEHLEDNEYGFKVECADLNLDHIIPLSKAQTENEVYELTHYSNFQLLPAVYNQFIKKTKDFDKEHFKNWLLETNYNKC